MINFMASAAPANFELSLVSRELAGALPFILEWLKFKSLIKSSKEVTELETSYTDGRCIK